MLPQVSLADVSAFLLVLARVGGALVFVPLPGMRHGPPAARVLLATGAAAALYPFWPASSAGVRPVQLAGWLAAEAAFGLTVGLAVAMLNEAFLLAAQIFGLPAGYSYAATIDPATEADSNVLLVFVQFLAGLLFFALGLHLAVLRIFAQSLEWYPPGSYLVAPAGVEAILRLGAAMFSLGLRLALPVVALLILADITLALLGRLHGHLQLLMLTFPIKMLGALALLAALMGVYLKVYRGAAETGLRALLKALGDHGG